jgi:hypothetical protein
MAGAQTVAAVASTDNVTSRSALGPTDGDNSTATVSSNISRTLSAVENAERVVRENSRFCPEGQNWDAIAGVCQ